MARPTYDEVRDPALTREALQTFLDDPAADEWVAEHVARHPNADAALIQHAVERWGAAFGVLWGAALNPATPLALLRVLVDAAERFGDSDEVKWSSIREAVAGNPSSAAALLAELVEYPDWAVQRAALGNPNATAAVARIALANADDHEGVIEDAEAVLAERGDEAPQQ